MVGCITNTMIYYSDIRHMVTRLYLVALAFTSMPVSNFHIQLKVPPPGGIFFE